MQYLIPKSFGIVKHSNGFTLNKKYSVIGKEGNCFTVKNDNGHIRSVLIDTDSPHLVDIDNKPAGRFILVEEKTI